MLLALLLCFAGFTGLCLSLDRHHGELLGHKPSALRRHGLRLGGWLLLGLSLAAAVQGTGWSLGLVQWCAVLMFSALLLVLLLPYRPRLVLTMAGASLLASPVAALAHF
ncbi:MULTISPECIES: DUF3325 domain-containing protein [Pseudomonas]|uniref:DUF3325 domain-containing protein n=2 Tax=Pseudomonas TaxID=286 RepID=A0A2C9EGU5_PSEPH|nr:DUF3325 domain-containing protein [Pseudomonas protegens]AGL82799.1 hypothetical protein PFLCHA0_c10070 [Pseudomonas protegens CHA0]MBP5109271.1 DUF3325 domain-containing protein [Pseudomonas protegens]QTU25702.1 DUF3325 domain-containing protein [Pseudomonas protegens]QTU29337.1 DUF3325 domain-containing protein [Pseudomonas protegens]RLO25478.1 DUF3325 domain-containing protein [Pseudomonas protegens]